MKLFLILLSAAALANASTFIPTARLRRDVSHLNLNYIPPPSTSYLPPLPPTLPKVTQPSNEYLPPVINEEQTQQPSNEYLPPEKEISTEAPVAEVKSAEEITELPQPTNEYLPPTNLGDITEIPAEPLAKTVEEPVENTVPAEPTASAEIVEAHTEAKQDTAVLKEDGYHYKTPSETVDLVPAPEYMLPLEEDVVVEVEGPSNGETAKLEEDGYHYRAIKRRF